MSSRVDSELQAIAGFARQLYYTERDGEEILAQHKAIAREMGVQRPYFDYTDAAQTLLVEERVSEDERVRVGMIGAFPAWLLAVWMNEQTNSYVFVSKTMGDEYPNKDVATNQKLVAAMIGEYRPDRVVVSFEKRSAEGEWTPYAGVQAYMGIGTQTIQQAIESGHTDSLSTLSALTIDTEYDDSLAYVAFLRDYGTAKEEQIIEMSRLWRRDNEALSQMGIHNTQLGWEAMAYLALGVEQAVLQNQLRNPAFLLYDTSKKIQTRLAELFGMRQIVQEYFLQPTQAVLGSVLGYHYGGADRGGYAGQLVMGMVHLGHYVLNAKLYLNKRKREKINGGES